MICPGDGKENDIMFCLSFNHGKGCRRLESCYKGFDLEAIRSQLDI